MVNRILHSCSDIKGFIKLDEEKRYDARQSILSFFLKSFSKLNKLLEDSCKILYFSEVVLRRSKAVALVWSL